MQAYGFLNVFVIQANDDGLTFREIVDSLPTDPGSLFVLVLLLGFCGVTLYFGVIRSGEDDKGSEEEPARDPSTSDDSTRTSRK